MKESTRNQLIEWAEKYNDPEYFREDPVMFPRKFAQDMAEGRAVLQDVEIAALFAAHFAWVKTRTASFGAEREKAPAASVNA